MCELEGINVSKQPHIAERLMDSAAELFLEKDFHSVSIRAIAAKADTTSAMINYYFDSKLGLFNAMLKREYGKILSVLYGIIAQEDLVDFSDTMDRVMSLYRTNPNIPRFILRTWMYQQSTGSQILLESFEHEKKLVAKWVEDVIDEGKVDRETHSEVVRIAFMALTLVPSMIQDLLVTSYGEKGYSEFCEKYIEFCGDALLYGVKPRSRTSR